MLENSHPKNVKSNIIGRKLRSGVNLFLQGALKLRNVIQVERKTRATCVRNLIIDTVHQIGSL